MYLYIDLGGTLNELTFLSCLPVFRVFVSRSTDISGGPSFQDKDQVDQTGNTLFRRTAKGRRQAV